ncbi:MAG: hypothetical protein KDA86_12515 [Planctomycetaceae bacterium]|nr:hypothetical protein [Planctomycetaceae bacterium]
MVQRIAVVSRFPWLAFTIVLLWAATGNTEEKLRTWFDVTGKHSMKATYVSHDDEKVTLRDPEGKVFEIELKQLSKPDRGYLERIAKSDSDESAEGSPLPDQPLVIGQSKERGVALDVHPSEPEWTFQRKPNAGLEFSPREFSIPLEEFGERATEFVITPSGQFAALTASYPSSQTRVSILDLSKKKVVASSSAAGDYLAVAVSDDGQRVAIRSDDFRDKRQIGVFRVSGKKLKPEGNFMPFPDLTDTAILWAGFVGDDQLAILCENAGITVWNLSNYQEDCYFELEGDSAATRNADGSVIAFADKEKVGLFQMADRSFSAVQPVPNAFWTKHLAFSPSEERLVGFGVNRLVTWETDTGKVISDIPELKLPGSAGDCVQENFVLINNRYLVDLENQLKLWSYNGLHRTASAGGVTFFLIPRRAGRNSTLAIAPVSLPDPEATTALDEALTQPDLFLLKPGGTVQLDVSKVPDAEREKVREFLIARLQENRISVSDDAVSTLVASISNPQPVTAIYYSRKDRVPHTYNFKVLNSKVELIHDGQVVWSQQSNNQPSSVYAKEGESISEKLSEATQKPNLFFFEHAHLPKLIQKKPESEGQNLQWTFGESTVK